MAHDYLINWWRAEGNSGTSPIFRTPDRKEWIKKIRELDLPTQWSRIIVYEDITILSFALNEKSWYAMNEIRLLKTPIQIVKGIPAYIKGDK